MPEQDEFDGDPECYDTCEICGARLIPYVNDMDECSACHAPGCHKCLEPGDDVFPLLCPGGCA